MGRVSGEAKGHGDESCQVRLEEQAIGHIERRWKIRSDNIIMQNRVDRSSANFAERTVSRKEILILAFDSEGVTETVMTSLDTQG